MNTPYIHPDQLLLSINNYKSCPAKENGTILAQNFKIIAKNIVLFLAKNDQNKVSQKDCVLACFENIDKFDSKKGNAFNYFTTIMLNNIRKQFKAMKKHEKYLEYLN